ncbi:phosphoribosylanthranilate isomerase [Tuwongella immobilis]|uniref:N-(5'-phosphoribosyl)anthranilate isomerase n=1 Tax=Tuwongella immobilis TaxID=692036 RepID=A0A6C2YNU8_9BACT|nr:phosphoribosylanthranilate isomerase [Tuwongella immobilis]VIP02562.1 n-(5 -phosphoribosyl)anthranilate isomerase : N-(5'-phosphoribosyl)anthranilate isomerase OS=Cystobacter violaceus Cb vi76 GN=trpF PE=3 SV=1: PRAI [Tuwongella immobilis]VTS01775.1 n-(5 -phosphoribosyl)anthranilate isomerase : N-(5'-phosphoribosyl)anthranilate isomerase OS=Cystobacter violaceus Cb vi76 GN=trpF PE=3 SV=1: PRAI [Tuwongella immobilis]
MIPRVKICCISSVREARIAIAAGASALGLVSAMPSGPGVIDEATIAEIATIVPPGVASFLLTSATDVDAIIAQQQRTQVNTLQLCDRLERGTLSDLRSALPGIALVQVVHVVGDEAIVEAREAEQAGAHAILLDSGDPRLPVKQLGGTSRRHDWRISRKIRESLQIPLFLAGGLRPENLRDAVETVGPFGLDLCTGVRTDGLLDAEKLQQFMLTIRGLATSFPGTYGNPS